jgi:hypothetical protein
VVLIRLGATRSRRLTQITPHVAAASSFYYRRW